VSRLQGRPVVLLGVSSDDSREAARRVAARQGHLKRSWWDGGRDGPIGARWNVEFLPTVYVIDAQGVIRYRGQGFDRELEAAVLALVREAEGGHRS
jgi:hypothetical protein